jgi:hypothetical protein
MPFWEDLLSPADTSGEAVPQTYDPDVGYSPAEYGDSVVNESSVDWSPGAINPGASSVDDLLKFGLARLVDAKSRPARVENVAPRLAAETRVPVAAAQGAAGKKVLGVPVAVAAIGALLGAWWLIRRNRRA